MRFDTSLFTFCRNTGVLSAELSELGGSLSEVISVESVHTGVVVEFELVDVDRDYEGDARFPQWDRTAFAEVERRPAQSAPTGGPGYAFVTYQRRPAA